MKHQASPSRNPREAICRSKVCYGSRAAAQRARWRASHRQRQRALGTYQCNCCEGWHLTSPKGARRRPIPVADDSQLEPRN